MPERMSQYDLFDFLFMHDTSNKIPLQNIVLHLIFNTDVLLQGDAIDKFSGIATVTCNDNVKKSKLFFFHERKLVCILLSVKMMCIYNKKEVKILMKFS